MNNAQSLLKARVFLFTQKKRFSRFKIIY